MKCNNDCFNCKFPDCQKDGISEAERKAQNMNDMEADPKKVKNRENSLKYYYKHREEILANKREKYKEDPQRVLKKNQEWRDKNRKRYNESQIRTYYRRKQLKEMKYASADICKAI